MFVVPCIAIPVVPRHAEGNAVDLAAREPSFMSLYRKARKVAPVLHMIPKPLRRVDTIRDVVGSLFKRSDDGELSRREIDDIELFIREFDDLVTREPFFGSLWRKVKHFVTIKNIKSGIDLAKELKGRDLSDLEELAAREPIVDASLKMAKEIASPESGDATSKHASNIVREDNPEMYVRDLEELDARDPFLDSFWRRVKPVATRKNVAAVSDLVRSFAREDNAEVFERDYELDELD